MKNLQNLFLTISSDVCMELVLRAIYLFIYSDYCKLYCTHTISLCRRYDDEKDIKILYFMHGELGIQSN